MSIALGNSANIIRSQLPGVGGVVANAFYQIQAELSRLSTAVDLLGGFSKDQLGNVSTNSLSIRNLTRRTDFYNLPEVVSFAAASYRIIPTGSWLRLQNTSGATITLTSLPTISPGKDGQFLEIINVGAHSFALQDNRILVGSGLALQGTTDLMIPPFAAVQFRYSTGAGGWLQIGPPLPPVAIGLGPKGTLYLSGFTFSTNSPGAGSIAWSSGIVTYQGIQYLVATGNSGTNFWIYWKLSSPTSFQSAAQGTPNLPALGADDFLIGLNNNSGNTFDPVINFVRSDGGHRYIITGTGMFLVNTSNKVVANLAVGGAEQGHITLWNSTQTAGNTIDLDPNIPKITVGGVAITVP